MHRTAGGHRCVTFEDDLQISYEINWSLFGFVLNITDYGASTEYVDIGLIAINCFSQQSNRSSKI